MAALFETPGALAPAQIRRVRRDDGSTVLSSSQSLRPYARCIGEWVERWASETPDVVALAERDGSGEWRCLSWHGVRRAIGSIAQTFLDMGLPKHSPVVVLSDNSVDHALILLGAMHVGIPVCSVSSAYSRQTSDFSKIQAILSSLDPCAVYASDARRYGGAIAAAKLNCPVILGEGAETLPEAMEFDSLLKTVETPAVMRAFSHIAPDDHAKYLLTSGSTGKPKVVINTHRMLCANQQMMTQVWPFLEVDKPRLVDWLPWSHTFGGNHNLNMVLCHGGSMYIDAGRPVAGLMETTLRNIADVEPNLLFNVPRGYDMMLPLLESDLDFARRVFGKLKVLFYAGAALPSATWRRLEAVAAKVREEPLWLTTSWGSTETSPAVTSAHWRLSEAGCIGAPLPGLEVKLVPNGGKQEIRVRGVTVFAGYRNAPEQTAAAFDEEGFYQIGDAGYLVNDEEPNLGIVFNGRVAEDFKLTSGTWVSVGTLRLKLISAFAPLVQDAVITGHNRHELGAMLFLSPACSAMEREKVVASLTEGLLQLRSQGGGSSQCPQRVLILSEPPSIDAGEITDKGYINQSAVLSRRASEVEALHGEEVLPHVIRIS